MTRLACVALLLVSSAAARAAGEDPVVRLYADVLEAAKNKPESTTVLLALRPPTDVKNEGQRAGMDAIVSYLDQKAADKPESVEVAHNRYQAVWTRYVYYRAEADAKRAFELLDAAVALVPPNSEWRARCAYELAANTAEVSDAHSTAVLGGDRVDAAIQRFLAAKQTAQGESPYVARSALALGGLYERKANVAEARKSLREALELDRTAPGYVTNRAYDRLGLLLLAEGNADGALAMLTAAGKIQPDEDIQTLGYACGLARRLIDTKTFTKFPKAVEYLQKAYNAAVEKKCLISPDFMYALALGYTKMGQPGPALLYWQKYLDLQDPNVEQQKKAKEIAQSLISKTGAAE